MATEAFLCRRGVSLVPTDEESEDAIRALPEGELVRCKIVRPRNPKRHRLWRTLLDRVVKAGAPYPDADALNFALKVALGRADLILGLDGKVYLRPWSTSFNEMEEATFVKFFDAAINLVCEQVLPGCDREDLVKEIFEMIEDKRLHNHGGSYDHQPDENPRSDRHHEEP